MEFFRAFQSEDDGEPHHVSADRLCDDAAAASFSLAGWGLKHRRRSRWHQHRGWERCRGNGRWHCEKRGRRRTHPSTRTRARHRSPRSWWGRFQIRSYLTDDAERKMKRDIRLNKIKCKLWIRPSAKCHKCKCSGLEIFNAEMCKRCVMFISPKSSWSNKP